MAVKARKDPRLVWLIFIILVIIPLVRPLGLPMSISDNTRTVSEAIKSVPEGGLVFLSPDFSVENRGELQPMLEVIFKHLLEQNVKIVSAGFYSMTSAIMMNEAEVTVDLEKYGKIYGEDFVNLGFLPGGEAAIAALGEDVHALAKIDYYNTPISEIPLMDLFKTAKDVDLVICISAGNEFTEKWMRQWQVKYDTKITGGSVSMVYPTLLGYIASGQLSGYLDSSRGAAEYELLTNKPGGAILTMDAQSIGHIFLIVIIIIGNMSDRLFRRSN